MQTDDIVKGYAIGADRYAVITDSELESIAPQGITDHRNYRLCELDQTNPIIYDTA